MQIATGFFKYDWPQFSIRAVIVPLQMAAAVSPPEGRVNVGSSMQPPAHNPARMITSIYENRINWDSQLSIALIAAIRKNDKRLTQLPKVCF